MNDEDETVNEPIIAQFNTEEMYESISDSSFVSDSILRSNFTNEEQIIDNISIYSEDSMSQIVEAWHEENPQNDVIRPWPEGTVCIIGDSTLNNLNEKKLGPKVKVRHFNGGIVEDMFDLAKMIIRRKPTYVILHVGTNNTTSRQEPETIVNSIIRLKRYIEAHLNECTVIVSSLLMRDDDHRANDNVNSVNSLLNNLNIAIILNDNIYREHLGWKGLHLNKRGLGRFASNFKSRIRGL